MATIEPNFESICIDPNDDLVLYKKEIVRSRIEKFLYAICSLDNDDLPTPLSRIEEMYKCLVTGVDFITFTPLSRAEKFVMAMLGAYDVELLPTPISRSETLMKKIATGDNNLDDIDNLQSRYEFLLAYIIKAGGFNGGSGDFYYVNYPINSSITTLYNTAEYPVKSAILKGQTLVNLVKKPTPENLGSNKEWGLQGSSKPTDIWNSNGSITITSTITGSMVLNYYNLTLFKPNKEYTLFVSVGWNDVGVTPHLSKISTNDIPLNNGLNIVKFTTVSDLTVQNLPLRLGFAGTVAVGCEYTFNNIMVLEGDWTNVDIPYFEGMASVKMPVLTTTGKNLFDGKLEIGYLSDSTGQPITSDKDKYTPSFIKIDAGKKYCLHAEADSYIGVVSVYYYDDYKNYLGIGRNIINVTDTNISVLFTPHYSGASYVRFRFFKPGGVDLTVNPKNIGFYESSTIIDMYEPYKSNILTVNEDVTLRSNGDICDELNLLTGQLTQRIGEDGAVLSQEVVKTVDLSTLDQDGEKTKLNTFDDITYVTVSSEGLVPTGDIDIARPIQFVDYSLDNGWTTLYNTFERPVKSAILTGNTLVNILSATNIKVSSKSAKVIEFNVQPNAQKRYVLFFKLNNIPTISDNSDNARLLKLEWYHASASGGFYALLNKNVVLDKTMTIDILPYTSDIQRTNFSVWCPYYESGELDIDVMIIEYQEGMENWDIPYFTGMTSVKMPVLTTIGKNLFDINKINTNYYNHNNSTEVTVENNKLTMISKSVGRSYISQLEPLYLKPNTEYTFSITGASTGNYKRVHLGTNKGVDNNQYKVIVFSEVEETKNVTFITDDTGYLFIHFYPSLGPIATSIFYNIQLEEGSTATPYEPYKSTTISCNEEVELRGIGDIKDELNLTTGELTQRIGEFVFDGSSDELWFITTNDSGFKRFVSDVKKTHSKYSEITNWLPTANKSYWTLNENGFYIGTNASPVIVFNTNDSRYNMSITEFENYLSQNPLIVQHPLVEETIKTVTLSTLDQDGKETELTTFDDITYVIVSSEGLVPTGEITVATKDATDVIDAGVMSLRMDDISNSQRTLEGSANAQSDDIDVTMLGTTDIYEQLL